MLQSVVDKNTDKGKEIEERKADLPLPEQPPMSSDWNSMNSENVNVGSGREGATSEEYESVMRDPPTVYSSVREVESEVGRPTVAFERVGRQGKDNLEDLPKDAKER